MLILLLSSVIDVLPAVFVTGLTALTIVEKKARAISGAKAGLPEDIVASIGEIRQALTQPQARIRAAAALFAICTAETILRGFAEATTWMACQKASSKIFKLLVDEHGLKKEELPTCVRDKIDSALKERREQFPSERGNIDREKDRARMPPPSGPPSKKARTS